MLYFNIMKFGLLLFFIHARGNFTLVVCLGSYASILRMEHV